MENLQVGIEGLGSVEVTLEEIAIHKGKMLYDVASFVITTEDGRFDAFKTIPYPFRMKFKHRNGFGGQEDGEEILITY